MPSLNFLTKTPPINQISLLPVISSIASVWFLNGTDEKEIDKKMRTIRTKSTKKTKKNKKEEREQTF